MSIDKVTQFSLRPPEFLQLFNTLGEYYRWFVITSKVKSDEFENKITISLSSCCWVDGLQRLIKVRAKALPEVIEWCHKVIQEHNIDIDDDSTISQMIQLILMIKKYMMVMMRRIVLIMNLLQMFIVIYNIMMTKNIYLYQFFPLFPQQFQLLFCYMSCFPWVGLKQRLIY